MSKEYNKSLDPRTKYFYGEDRIYTPKNDDKPIFDKVMKFELGKYYQHTTGHKLYICGLADTYIHGRCFVGEDEYGYLIPIGNTQENAVNYTEITKAQFIGNRV